MNLKHRHPPDILQNLTRKCFQGVGEFDVLNLHYGGEFEKVGNLNLNLCFM